MKVKLKDLIISDRLTALRTVDAFTVSRYRIAMRSGAQFPQMVINRDTMEIVSGNHRFTAMIAEYGEDHEVEVDARRFKADAEIIRVFAAENVANGRPMDGWTMRKIAIALTEAGESMDAVAALLNVPVGHLQKWGDRTVVVKGRGKERRIEPVKAGVHVPTGQMTEKQYEHHADADIGMTVRELAEQLSYRLEQGWIDVEDESEVAALARLRTALG